MTRSLINMMCAAALAAAAALFLTGGSLYGFLLLGFDLELDRRGFRICNNFADGLANDNRTPDPDFGGAHGAVLAVCKGAAEWGSRRMGNSPWGNGGANFDFVYLGEAETPGAATDNIASARHTNGGNTIAVTTAGADGWRIRFYEFPFVWNDGPESTPEHENWVDLQGIAAHEFGHALGLGHSSDPAATMFGYLPGAGNWLRTIEADDASGLRAVYGAASAAKPRIESISGGTHHGETLTLRGGGFSVAGNEVWFTGDGSAGEAVKVTSVPSYAGGTMIDVAVPPGARDGVVAVKIDAAGHDALSNPFPLQVIGSTGGVPVPDIKVDGQDGPLTVASTDLVTVTVSLYPNGNEGLVQECWVYLSFERGFVYAKRWWRLPGSWSAAPAPSYIGPLLPVENRHVLTARLPAGLWIFHFSIDAVDGYPSGTRLDSIEVTSL